MTITIRGIDDVKKILQDITPKRAANLMKATIRGIATETKKEIAPRVPKNTGNLKKSLKVKARRSHPLEPVFNVVFATGKGAKNDGFYWRFLEYGTVNNPNALNFVRDSIIRIESNLDPILINQFSKKLESTIKRELKIQAAKNK